MEIDKLHTEIGELRKENKALKLKLRIVSRSVWVVQNTYTGGVFMCFKTEKGAREFIEGADGYNYIEVKLGN